MDEKRKKLLCDDLEVELKNYLNSDEYINTLGVSGYLLVARHFANWQKEHLWKPANGYDLPEIDREVIALTQPYPNDEHLKVVFAHRPNKYAKVWNSDLGEEQVVEIEGYDKGGWNIPDVKWWLDCLLPKEIEL